MLWSYLIHSFAVCGDAVRCWFLRHYQRPAESILAVGFRRRSMHCTASFDIYSVWSIPANALIASMRIFVGDGHRRGVWMDGWYLPQDRGRPILCNGVAVRFGGKWRSNQTLVHWLCVLAFSPASSVFVAFAARLVSRTHNSKSTSSWGW